jgi:alginate O-acetyltransferase complex protein AlgI
MIFNSIEFIFFFSILLLFLFILNNKSESFKKGVLLIASYFFYGYWNWKFLGLIFITTIMNYVCANRITSSTLYRNKKLWLSAAIVCNLGILSFFKYFNFFIESLQSVWPLEKFPLRNLDIILPLGISFFTFQATGFIIDVYRQKTVPVNKLDFALFIAFFPQLLAGPISRASQFFPQLNNRILLKSENFKSGLQQFLIGFMKKVLLADSLSIFVNEVYRNIPLFDRVSIIAAVIAYSFQIYFDFSGYTDMAIGAARVLGFELPVNFRYPYRSRNVTEFWRRWHISLSLWLKDYLYISFGGNKKGRYRTYFNLLATMAIGGLWHGANWTFVFWGVFHGLCLAIHKFYSSLLNKNSKESEEPFQKPKNILEIINEFLSILATFIFIALSWVLFRSPDISTAIEIFKIILWGNEGIRWIHISFYLIIPFFFLWQLNPFSASLKEKYIRFDTLSGLTVSIAILLLIIFFSPIGSSPFIYFQF